ncbi:MAG: N-acetylmuramoyl-L-alanine amidase family protein [Synergistetes bacterium]|nr:N-acetylmuramoyl-L-alanine amidase family protein [Synergistota bacterium]MCX8127794.1 N-acetylmuramoyl-L-alanine amidase family protein [Synergistota bacterium]MDW8192056.1 N-acetylmuramoyl-L-alanine amidase [Synergistota bacterium]
MLRKSFLIFLILLFSLASHYRVLGQELSLFVDGEKKGNVSIIVSDGINYVSAEDLAKAIGGNFKYNPTNGSFSFVIEKKVFQLQVNNPTALVDGKIKLLDNFPKAVGNKIYVPLSFILSNTSIKFDPSKNLLFLGREPSFSGSQSEKPTLPLPGKVEEVSPSPSTSATPVSILPTKPDVSLSLSNVRYYSANNYTRIVFDLSKIPEYTISVEGGYIVVNLKAVRASKEEVYKIRDGLVKDVEILIGEGVTRVKVGVEGTPIYRDFILEQPPRLVLDVLRKGQPAPSPSVVSPVPSATEVRPSQGISVRSEEAEVKGKGKFLIVVDPGHGGADPGTIGPMGTKEKDVVLSISLYLREELVKRGYRVALTRDKDIYIPLEERTKIANKLRADVFISIHCNASFSSSVNGSEVYYMSLPSDSSAMAVALRENMEVGLGSEEVKRKTEMLVRILEDMMKNVKINESSKLAEEVYKALSKGNLETPVKRVAQAPFFVLRGAAMPAVLVEIGFMSNPKDEKLLRTSSWQKRIALLLADGLDVYLSSIR